MASGGTCHKQKTEAPSLFQNGKLVFQVYHIGWIISGTFALIATTVSLWLVNKHLQWYSNKYEQRYIVRLLFMVPIYAIISFTSFLFWNHSTPLLLIRDAYEAVVLTSFFYLLLMYLSPDLVKQQRIFLKHGLSRESDVVSKRNGRKLNKWVIPLGFVKWKPVDGLYFLQLMKWGVLQYCIVRPTTTLIAIILDYLGLYCEDSWGPGWGHIYIVFVMSLSVTIAMFCLIQLYVPIKEHLTPHKPLTKLFAVKAVVFLTFWQATFLAVLSMLGVIKSAKFMTVDDVNIGIGALLETFEMMIFSFFHIHAFTYKPYCMTQTSSSSVSALSRTPRLCSLGHAMDFRETFREVWAGLKYLYDKLRGNEPNRDIPARRAAHYRIAFGRSRVTHPQSEKRPNNPPKTESKLDFLGHLNNFGDMSEVDVDGERGRLVHGLSYYERNNTSSNRLLSSEADHIDSGIYSSHNLIEDRGIRQSWWRALNYDHPISTSHTDQQQKLLHGHRRSGASTSHDYDHACHVDLRMIDNIGSVYDDPSPATMLYSHDDLSEHGINDYGHHESGDESGDVLSSLSRFRSHTPHYNRKLKGQKRHLHTKLVPFVSKAGQELSMTSAPIDSEEQSPVDATGTSFHRADSVLQRLFPPSPESPNAHHIHDLSTISVRSDSQLSVLQNTMEDKEDYVDQIQPPRPAPALLSADTNDPWLNNGRSPNDIHHLGFSYESQMSVAHHNSSSCADPIASRPFSTAEVIVPSPYITNTSTSPSCPGLQSSYQTNVSWPPTSLHFNDSQQRVVSGHQGRHQAHRYGIETTLYRSLPKKDLSHSYSP